MSRKNDPAFKEALRRARARMEQLRTRGVFTLEEFHAAVEQDVQDLLLGLARPAVWYVVETVDDEYGPEQERSDQPLLPGFDLEGNYRLGDGTRIAKKLARREHFLAAMTIHDVNLRPFSRANNLMHEEWSKLEPFFIPGRTKEQAIEAYLESGMR